MVYQLYFNFKKDFMSYQHELFPKDIHSKYLVSTANKMLDIINQDGLHEPSKVH